MNLVVLIKVCLCQSHHQHSILQPQTHCCPHCHCLLEPPDPPLAHASQVLNPLRHQTRPSMPAPGQFDLICHNTTLPWVQHPNTFTYSNLGLMLIFVIYLCFAALGMIKGCLLPYQRFPSQFSH